MQQRKANYLETETKAAQDEEVVEDDPLAREKGTWMSLNLLQLIQMI